MKQRSKDMQKEMNHVMLNAVLLEIGDIFYPITDAVLRLRCWIRGWHKVVEFDDEGSLYCIQCHNLLEYKDGNRIPLGKMVVTCLEKSDVKKVK